MWWAPRIALVALALVALALVVPCLIQIGLAQFWATLIYLGWKGGAKNHGLKSQKDHLLDLWRVIEIGVLDLDLAKRMMKSLVRVVRVVARVVAACIIQGNVRGVAQIARVVAQVARVVAQIAHVARVVAQIAQVARVVAQVAQVVQVVVSVGVRVAECIIRGNVRRIRMFCWD